MPEGMAKAVADRPGTPGGSVAIHARAVEKHFGGTAALKGVDVTAAVGSINALVGENGAGKSTFLGIIAGRVVPTAGSVAIFGKPHVFGNPRLSRQQGIAAIYQELTIVPAMSAEANVFLGQPLAQMGLLSERAMRERFLELCAELKVSIPPGVDARRLSVADQQMLEIMRGIQSRARLILFDEPTTALAPPERQSLFTIMRALKAGGTTMMFVSHNLDEVLEIADAVTVFRDGELARAAPRDAWNKRELVRAMIGHDLVEPGRRTPFVGKPGAPPLLDARGVSLPGAIENIDIAVRPGEIVGVGGLVGSGRSSLLRSLAGFEPRSNGTLAVEGAAAPWPTTPRMALDAGIALVPEDRKTQGLVLGMSAMANITMPDYGGVARFGVVSDRKMAERARIVAREFGFDETRVGAIVRNLSGGNQQKVLLGRWRYSLPRVLLVDEPTRGIDVGAKEEILVTLRKLAGQGLGIIVVSSELEEVVQMGDRVLVLSEGKAVAALDTADGPVTVRDILEAAFKVARHEHDRVAGHPAPRTTGQKIGALFLQFGMVWALILLVIVGSLVYPRLLNFINIRNFLSQSAPVGIVAVGMTFVMIGGGFDLSVGAIFALGAVVFASLADPLGLWAAGLAVLLVAAACGVINGFIVTKLKVNPFVATLGSGSAFGGLAYIYSRSAPITPNNLAFQDLGTERWLGLPISVWLMIVVFIVGGFVLARTVYGRSIYAIGGNNEAARLSGLRVDLLRGSTYVLSGMCSGLGGMILASRLAVGQADMGSTIALDAIAIVVIGGTSLLGGEGAMWRTAIGLLIIAILTNIFDSLAVSTNYQLVVKGTIVIAAVAWDLYARSLRT